MSNFYDEKAGVYQVYGGCDINETIREGINISRSTMRSVSFDFNDVRVTLEPTSDPDLIYRDWQRAMSGYTSGPVGPHPAAELTEAEKAHDAAVETENEQRRQKAQADYDVKMRQREADAAAKLANDPGIELADADGWQAFKDANTDGYGGAVVTYAERWARLMQVGMARGETLESIADTASREADIEGITGFMYGCAVSVLSKCWKHGEALRRWHNLKTQIGTEGEQANESGGVLNPALLNIG